MSILRAASRRALLLVLAATAGWPAAGAGPRVYLARADVELLLVGRGLLSRNLYSGMLSHWEFRPDRTVLFVNHSGPGQATGTWSIEDDGRMCVTMLGRTGCRYWFREGDRLANSDSRRPEAATVAEVRFE